MDEVEPVGWGAAVETVLDGLSTADVEAWCASADRVEAIEDEGELPGGWGAAVEAVLSGMSASAVEQFAGRAWRLSEQARGAEAGLYLRVFTAAVRALAWIALEEAIFRGIGEEGGG